MLKIMKKNKSCVVAFLITVCLVYPWSKACGAEKGTWDLSENGKHWMFFYSPGNPAEDEWIEYEGKEYYLDSKGYMKTGWVTDKGRKKGVVSTSERQPIQSGSFPVVARIPSD